MLVSGPKQVPGEASAVGLATGVPTNEWQRAGPQAHRPGPVSLHGPVRKLRIVAFFHRGVERVAVDVGQRELWQRAMAHKARGAAMAASLRSRIEVAEAIPAKAARTVQRW